jgi:hypothetical protein
MPDSQRRLVGPLQVVDDQHSWRGRTQLIRQRDPDRRSLATAEGLGSSTENRELMLTANPPWRTNRPRGQ